MRGVCVLRGVRGGPIYTSGGWFPANACMEGDQETWQLLLLEVHLDGSQARFGRPRGSADPTWQALVLILLWQADRYAYVWRARLLCQMGPLCKWVTPDAIFCVVVWRLLLVFVLFHSYSSEMYKTRKQLWSKVSDINT